MFSFSCASSDLAEEAFSCSLLRVRAADTRTAAVLFQRCGSLRVTKPDSQLSEEQTLSLSFSFSLSLFIYLFLKKEKKIFDQRAGRFQLTDGHHVCLCLALPD